MTREDLIKRLYGWKQEAPLFKAEKELIEECILQLSFEPDRPHGEWIWKSPTPKTIMTPHCSNCGHMNDFLIETNFCPCCGADMRPKEGEVE